MGEIQQIWAKVSGRWGGAALEVGGPGCNRRRCIQAGQRPPAAPRCAGKLDMGAVKIRVFDVLSTGKGSEFYVRVLHSLFEANNEGMSARG